MEAVHLERLREAEIEAVRPWFPPASTVLELGAGSGWQARRIAAWGCDVTAVDVPGSDAPATAQHWPVREYDGARLPFPDASFDLVYSSAVLEHVRDLPLSLAEIRRVLRPGGRAVHLLPSPVWRFWTSVAAPFDAGRTWMRRRFRLGDAAPPPAHGHHGSGTGRADPASGTPAQAGPPPRRRSLLARLHRLLLAPHGEYPNAIAELYHYARGRWQCEFENHGFEVVRVRDNGLFYTGFGLCPHLPVESRRALARVLGAACHLFLLRKRS